MSKQLEDPLYTNMQSTFIAKEISNKFAKQVILDVAKCSRLEDVSTLDFSKRKLSRLDPDVFSKLVSVESLNLSNNLISYFPCNLGLKKLRILNVNNNRLRTVRTLWQFCNLENLDIRMNPLFAADICILVCMLPKLEVLNGSSKDVIIQELVQTMGGSLDTSEVKETWNKVYLEDIKEQLSATEITTLQENLLQTLSSQIQLTKPGPLVNCARYLLTTLEEKTSADCKSHLSTPLSENISISPIDYNGLIIVESESGDVIEQVVDCKDGTMIVLENQEGTMPVDRDQSEGIKEFPVSSIQKQTSSDNKVSQAGTSASDITDPYASSELNAKEDKKAPSQKHENPKMEGLETHLKPVGVIVNRITLNKRNADEKCFQSPYNSKLATTQVNCKIPPEDVPAGQELFKCNFCDMSYRSKEVYQRHTDRHTGVNPYECLICQKSFKTRESYKNHITIHTGEKRFKCRFCDASFRIRATWELHESKHTCDKPFKCQFCDKPFTLRRVCRAHERIHTGEKKFSCQFCDLTFRFESRCKTHERRHTGEKPFKCRFCVKSFPRKHQCTRHERLHTGEKPFKCQFCDKHFKSKESCVIHEGTHIGELSFMCQFCSKLFTTQQACVFHVNSNTCKKSCAG